jgi:hypothetical protein
MVNSTQIVTPEVECKHNVEVTTIYIRAAVSYCRCTSGTVLKHKELFFMMCSGILFLTVALHMQLNSVVTYQKCAVSN